MLLDTCALLWIVGDQRKLSATTLEKIDSAPIISISAISAFEIGVKAAKRKLTLSMPVDEWWKKVIKHHHIDCISVSDDILLRAVSLPRIHSDLADRIIIATALIKNFPIVTADPQFSRYGVTVLI